MMKALDMVLAHVVEETSSVIIRECEQSETQQLLTWDFSVEAESVNTLLILEKVKGTKKQEIEHRQQARGSGVFGCLLSDHIPVRD